MKKKILALCLVVVLVATAITGVTLAYFTDVDQNTNEFAVGNVKIDLYEKVAMEDAAGNGKGIGFDIAVPDGLPEVVEDGVIVGKGNDFNANVKYNNINPGDKMTKIVTVENNGKSEAYIALTIKNDNYLNFNQKVDDYYEGKGYTDEQMQEITDDVWSGSGWGLRYTKPDASKDLRYMMIKPAGTATTNTSGETVTVLGYGYANSTVNNNVNVWNYAETEGYDAIFPEVMRATAIETEDGNFDTLTPEHTRMWIIYLKVPANTSYTVDLTTVCPTYFDNDSTTAFEGMALDIKSFAIQTAGFATATEAFAELFQAGDCFAY